MKGNKKKRKKKQKEDNTVRNLTIIIIIIIIILLLLHNCVLTRKEKEKHGDNIDICDGTNCSKKPLINCLTRAGESTCDMPDFKGKTKTDINKWLKKISNNIDVEYIYVESEETAGTIINQSVAAGTKVKTILDNNIKIIIYISSGSNGQGDDTPTTPDDKEEKKKPTNNSSGKTDQNILPSPIYDDDDEEEDEEEEPLEKEVIVRDPRIKWTTETEAKIFENSMYIDKIAPEAYNTYRFTVLNNTESSVKYNVSFTETNNYNINMKYKLRKNNTYIVDHYVSIDQINIDEALLNSKKSDTFYLEWKWISSENDTEIGATKNANYSLKIDVTAEGIDE